MELLPFALGQWCRKVPWISVRLLERSCRGRYRDTWSCDVSTLLGNGTNEVGYCPRKNAHKEGQRWRSVPGAASFHHCSSPQNQRRAKASPRQMAIDNSSPSQQSSQKL